MLPKLILMPHYPGSAKYLEGLIPYLKEEYDVYFLFTPKIKERFIPEMIDYCKQKDYQYHLIKRLSAPLIIQKIPLLYQPLLVSLDYRKKIRQFLKTPNIKKIITNTDTNFYHNYLLKKANQIGIDTMLLQWSAIFERAIPKREQKKERVRKPLLKILPSFINKKLTDLLMNRGNTLKTPGGGQTQRFGVMNKKTYRIYLKEGVAGDKMAIVGSLDLGIAEQIQKQLSQNLALKNQAAEKYHINQSKQNIAIFSHPFNIKDVSSFSNEQQAQFFENIVTTIREIFPASQVDILFKIHPAEDINLYEPLKKYGVKLFDKNADNEIIVYFANLYISHFSTTNFIPMVMKKPAIFLNIVKLRGAEQAPNQKFASTQTEFKKLLTDFKNNQLEKQYELTEEIYAPNSLEKIISWIN